LVKKRERGSYGEIRNQIDAIWNAFWSGGIANPLEVIEQITYLLFLRRLDELQEVEELKATCLEHPVERRIFPEGKDVKGAEIARQFSRSVTAYKTKAAAYSDIEKAFGRDARFENKLR
jgi:HsdM N-terminal domain